MTLHQFFYMHGYAWSVWTSYALALVVLGLNVIVTHLIRCRTQQKIIHQKQRQEFFSHEYQATL